MPISAAQIRWFDKLAKQMSAINGVDVDAERDDQIEINIVYNGARETVFLGGVGDEIRDQKQQYSEIRDTLTKLGIIEGQPYVPPKRPRQGMTPQMAAARAAHQKEFEAWQEVWRTVRQAETSLDREYELSIMKDYY
ncbi:MAG: hypothetical protein CMM52_14665 [Rhodospirillaceae bacterium]|nr:hypothetical protein [Rhodospirillaceae bacterium]|tara:strand:+ start:69 stop:479 length:411 start_codon:yes stop_codon:yes gene_type:complete